MKTSTHQNVTRRKRRIERRLRPRTWQAQPTPMFRASNIQYAHSDRVRGLASGGIGAMHRLARHTGLVAAIDQHVEVLKRHLPYHESDHVLNVAYNILCGGTCVQDLELRRQDEVYLDALGAQRIPDPTTAGDVCRRFDVAAIEALQTAINETRVRVWRAQPAAFFDEERFYDVRKRPIKFASYAISARRWEARGRYVTHVGIERGSYLELKAHLEDLSVHRSRETLERMFFEPYAPVRRQLVTIWNRVNVRRKLAGFELLDLSCLRLRRRIVRPFESPRLLDVA